LRRRVVTDPDDSSSEEAELMLYSYVDVIGIGVLVSILFQHSSFSVQIVMERNITAVIHKETRM
jgi:hypothetical protein